jgi:membrane protein DedA with SNARE-associated domain/rhodanese-related sulfurtransferase
VRDAFEQYGVLFVVINVLAERIGLPLPALPTLIVVGALAAHSGTLLAQLFVLSSITCLAAESAWYLAGRRYGGGIMKLLCRISLNPDSCVIQTQVRFERWGSKMLVIAKFVPGLSLFAPPLAGATRMPWARFALYSLIGDMIWVGLGLGVGILLGPQVLELLPHVQHLGRVLGVVLGAVALIYIAWKWIQRRRFFATLRMARISVAELYRLIESGAEPVIVDVRSSVGRTLEPRRIPGALPILLGEVDQHVRDLPRDREIVIYCSCPNEASAARIAKILMSQGFKRVRPLEGGLEAWLAAGYKAETPAEAATALAMLVADCGQGTSLP